MNFYFVIKYVIMALFLAVLVGAYVTSDEKEEQQTNAVPSSGSKFNF